MNLTDLIQKAGLENIQVQYVHDSLVKVQRRKLDTDITFASSHEMGNSIMEQALGNLGTHVALVLWIPRDKL